MARINRSTYKGGNLKNRSKKFLIPVAGALVAVLALGTTTVSAKSNSQAVKKAAGCAVKLDAKLEASDGVGAAAMAQAIACAKASPLVAKGKAIVIGMDAQEGTPGLDFPEYARSAQAAVDYINKELGGLGADYKAGTPGVPIKLEVCKHKLDVPEILGCANSLAAKKPILVFTTLDVLSMSIPIWTKAKIPVVVGTPVTAMDFGTNGVFAIGGGGGCLGVHTSLVQYATQALKSKKLGVPWADTPPGVFCYNDLESKPLDVLGYTNSGLKKAIKVPGATSKLKGTAKGSSYLGVSITSEATSTQAGATKIMAYEPDAIIYSNAGSACWDFVTAIKKLGWTQKKTPLVLGGSCIDFATMETFGDSIDGVVVMGTASLTKPTIYPAGSLKRIEAQIYMDKMAKYDSTKKDRKTGFANAGFTSLMQIWQMANKAGKAANGLSVGSELSKTDGHHAFGGNPLACKKSFKPYQSVCNPTNTASKWDSKAKELVPVVGYEAFSGLDLIGGTALRVGRPDDSK